MNLILLEPGELSADGTVRLRGRRAEHVVSVLRPAVGAALEVGVVGGRLGTGEVLALSAAPATSAIPAVPATPATPGTPPRPATSTTSGTSAAEVVLRVSLSREPPPRAPVDLLLAMPRPKILRKVLAAAASMGVGRLVLLGSYRVERAYFSSPLLAPEALAAQLRLGLEQGRDTVLPEITVRRLFKPFVEDELDGLLPAPQRLLADPGAAAPLAACPPAAGRVTLAIGPEGGWTAYEAERLRERGFVPFSLGERILRVDTAVPYAVGQVELWLRAADGRT
jgi:RsmE family RNA methyltransferase